MSRTTAARSVGDSPITSIAATVGGPRVQLTGLVPEGTNSHTFEPKPSVAELLSNLAELIPGAEGFPRFVRNRSEQFEARFVMLEVQPTPSLFFEGMAGSLGEAQELVERGEVELGSAHDHASTSPGGSSRAISPSRGSSRTSGQS